MIRPRRAVGLIICLSWAVIHATSAAEADDLEQPEAFFKHVRGLIGRGQYASAEPHARKLVELAEESPRMEPAERERCRETLAECCRGLGNYGEAEALYKKAAEFWENNRHLDGADVWLAANLSQQGDLCWKCGRYVDAESLHLRALEIREGLPSREGLYARARRDKYVADSLLSLGELYRRWGRYAKAEFAITRAMEIFKRYSPLDPSTASSLQVLAEIYRCQGRLRAAERLYHEALSIWEQLEKRKDIRETLRDIPKLAKAAILVSLGLLYADLWREQAQGALQNYAAEAEEQFQRALAILDAFPDHPHTAGCRNNLGRLLHDQAHRGIDAQANFERASRCYRDALRTLERARDANRHNIADTRHNLALLEYDRKHLPAAEEELRNAMRMLGDDPTAPLEYWYKIHYLRAKIAWANGQEDQALEDLEKSIELALKQRARASGTAFDRARYFAQLSTAVERMVGWQCERAQALSPPRARQCVEEAFHAVERVRALSFMDQVELHGRDLLADLSPGEARDLRKEEKATRVAIASLTQQLSVLHGQSGLTGKKLGDRRKELEDKLRAEQEKFEDIRRKIWNAVAAQGTAMASPHEPATLEHIEAWAAKNEALVLEYFMGAEGVYVLVVGGGAPSLEKLAVDERNARRFQCASGALTRDRLARVLTNEQREGVFQRLKDMHRLRPPHPWTEVLQEALPALSALWDVLIPPGQREAVETGRFEFKRLVVIPDGVLAKLPFETLVVDDMGVVPKYLLDAGPPVLYAPSATILLRLAEHQPGPAGAMEPVLTVGNPKYPPADKRQPPPDLPEGSSLFPLLLGRLETLQYADNEIDAVQQVFRQRQIDAKMLVAEKATEANVRAQTPGRRLLHLACHGFVDQAHGNLFGALALTPGADPTDPTDDGFLTLAEVYELDLSGCEAVFLSACETNLGPEQRGEGMWALSRGFLIAGATRVVASNWQVDDKSTAKLVECFCRDVAEAQAKGHPVDYASALQRAKRAVLHDADNPHWESPFCWGPFVLVGPP